MWLSDTLSPPPIFLSSPESRGGGGGGDTNNDTEKLFKNQNILFYLDLGGGGQNQNIYKSYSPPPVFIFASAELRRYRTNLYFYKLYLIHTLETIIKITGTTKNC